MSEDTTPGQLDILARLNEGDARMKRIEADLAANTTATKANADAMAAMKPSLDTLIEWLNNFNGLFRVLNGVGSLAKPVGQILVALTAISGAVGSVWLAVKHFWPK